MTAADLSVEELARRLTQVEKQLTAVRQSAARAADRGAVENVFNRYMHYHNAYEDQRIIDELWAKPGTPGIRSRYNNVGAYTTYESVTAYHRGRPRPIGKLLLHYTTTPVIEIGADGQTAKGLWLMAGTESGLTDPEVAGNVPAWVFSGGEVDGKRVWAHWVWCKYGVDFLKQDDAWRIWHFRCFEVARAPFHENWIAFAARNAESFDKDLMYFGEDGRPRFMPAPDAPATRLAHRYRPDESQTLDPRPPSPYRTFDETFEY